MPFFTAKSDPSALVRQLIVPALLGLAAGVAGALTAESYLATVAMPVSQPVQIGRPTVSVTSPLPQAEIAARLARVDLPLYPRKAAGTDAVDRARSASEAVGYAAAITSDGWLATQQGALAGPIVVGVGGRLLEPKQQIVDPRTGVVFLKIDASALYVTGFEDTDVLRQGAPLYAFDDAGQFVSSAFSGTSLSERKVPAGPLRDSDRFSRAFRLDRKLGTHAFGGAVLTAGGNLAGIVMPGKDGADAFVPMHVLRPVLSEAFRGQAPLRAVLGAHYLMLDDAAFSGDGFGAQAGALLAGSRALGLPAVRSGSAAAAAGLAEGDIILRVDDIELSGGRDLAEVIAEYDPGAKLRFEALRKGERKIFEVTLD